MNGFTGKVHERRAGERPLRNVLHEFLLVPAAAFARTLLELLEDQRIR